MAEASKTSHTAVLGMAQLGDVMLGSAALIRPLPTSGPGHVHPKSKTGTVQAG